MHNSYTSICPAKHTANKALDSYGWAMVILSVICGLMWVACDSFPEPVSYRLSQEQLQQRHDVLARSNAVAWRIIEGGE